MAVKKNAAKMQLGADCKKLRCKSYRIGSVALHWHEFYEIEVVTDGAGTHLVNGTAYEWRRGEMHLMRLVDFHRIDLLREGEVHLIQIKPALIPPEFLKALGTSTANLVTYLSERELSYIDALCTLLEEQGQHDSRLSEHILSVILTLFFQKFEISPTPTADDELLGQVLLYIGENFRSDLTLEGIAKQFFISKNYLCTYFKKRMGRTVLSYIKECRLGYAMKLTVSTELKSIEICEACGYGSVSNFLRDFKKVYGTSPMLLRSTDTKGTAKTEEKKSAP